MAIQRIEVFLDGSTEPVRVLKEPPFKLTLNTANLPDGDHTLRMVTHYTGGKSEVKTIPFKVSNLPGLVVEGLEAGKEVAGDLEVTLRVADADQPVTSGAFPAVGSVIATAIILLGIWLFFVLTPTADHIVEEVSPPAAEGAAAGHSSGDTAGHSSGGAAAGEAVAVDQALLTKGGEIYNANCVGCHQAEGAGMAPMFPRLAKNPHLADAAYVTNVVINGLQNKEIVVDGQTYNGVMPGFAQLSDEDVAAVATFVRNSWGNQHGGVTAETAAAQR